MRMTWDAALHRLMIMIWERVITIIEHAKGIAIKLITIIDGM
jgi:hypothetical protein